MKKKGEPSISGLDLLLGWLDPDTDVAAERYVVIRRRLVKVFAGRGCYEADELADRTIDRVAIKLPDIIETYSGDPVHYFLGIARNVFREWLRNQNRVGEADLDHARAPDPEPGDDPAFACLDECLGKFHERQRTMIIGYYQDDKRAKIELRRVMAESMGITPTALQIRVHRIRKILRRCVEECVDAAA